MTSERKATQLRRETRKCCATNRKGDPCGNRAGFIYQVVQGREEPLCALHAKRFWGSQNLREIREEARRV